MSASNYDHIDPVAVRKDLHNQRNRQVPFEQAWQYATRRFRRASPEVMRFMEKHFRAAYYNNMADEGRCRVPDRDVSGAIHTHDPLVPLREYERCRSADECDRPATRGRFGRYWCEHHGSELSAIAAKLKLDGGTSKGAAIKGLGRAA